MNAELKPDSIGQLTVQERAVVALGVAEREQELVALAGKTTDITTITNPDGYTQVHAARIVLKNERVELEKRGKAARDDATKFSKAVIAEEGRLIALIQPEERRLQAIEDGWEAKIKAEKEAKIQAEIARVAKINQIIDGIRGWPLQATGKPSTRIAELVANAEGFEVAESIFAERTEDAMAVLAASLAALQGLLVDRLAHEEAQRKLEEGRKELERLQAEEAERQRIAREVQAKADAEAKATRDAEAARQAEENRLERERIAKEEADAKAVRDAETKRLADERAENDRIARERQADLDRQAAQVAADQEALRKASEPPPLPAAKPRVRMTTEFDMEEIIHILMNHYKAERNEVVFFLDTQRWMDSAA